MSAEPAEGKDEAREGIPAYRRIGHKGADTIVAGNTAESFDAAVEVGVDMIELDVLREQEGRLIVAHDHHDALRRKPMDLTDALDLFLEPPLDKVEIDCDLKLPGREAELAGALSGRGLVERAMVSTMEVESLVKLRKLEPDLRLGWTYPKTRRDWTQYGWAGPAAPGRALCDPPPLPRHPREEGSEARRERGLGLPPDHHATSGGSRRKRRRGADRLDRRRRRADARAAGHGRRRDLLERPPPLRGGGAPGRGGGRREARPGSAAPASARCRGDRSSATPPRRARSRVGPRRPTRA